MNANTTFRVSAILHDSDDELVTDLHPTPEAAVAQALHVWNLEDDVLCEVIRAALLVRGEFEDHTALLVLEAR